MIDWLRGEPRDPTVTIGGREVPLAIRRHARAKRMTMRMAPDGSEVRITLPRWGRTADALVFVKSRGDWLERQLAAVPRAAPPTPGGSIAYRGQRLAIEWDPCLPRKAAPTERALQLGGPEATVPARVQRWLEGEALRLVQHDLDHYCALAVRPVPRLRLSRALRRWGSCSGPKAGAGRSECIASMALIQAPEQRARSSCARSRPSGPFRHSPAF